MNSIYCNSPSASLNILECILRSYINNNQNEISKRNKRASSVFTICISYVIVKFSQKKHAIPMNRSPFLRGMVLNRRDTIGVE